MPPCASGPVLTVSRPSLNGSAWAMAGAGNRVSAAAAPAAVPAKTVRRLSLRDVDLRDIRILPLAPFIGCIAGRRAPTQRQFRAIIGQAVPPCKVPQSSRFEIIFSFSLAE